MRLMGNRAVPKFVGTCQRSSCAAPGDSQESAIVETTGKYAGLGAAGAAVGRDVLNHMIQ
jgi:hypothetical protein